MDDAPDAHGDVSAAAVRVLVADDNRVSVHLLAILLREWGHEPVVVSDGRAAWEVLQGDDPPRLCILDWMMPGLDGVELCRRVRASERDSGTYLLLLTVNGRPEDVVTGLDAGADDYVVKPFDARELRARVSVGARVVGLRAALARRVGELENALDHVRLLQGLLPICMYCHRIRTDKASWQAIETYLSEHSDVRFSHGICPVCMKEHHPEDAED